jgi:hypothetical protein
MRTALVISIFLALANSCFAQGVAVSLKSIEVTPGQGSELTDTYRWNHGEKPYVLYAYGVLESASGKRLSLPISKHHHVYNLWAGSFNGDLVLSFINYSGGYGTDLLCLVKVEAHKLKWCKRVSSQIVRTYRAAPTSGLPLDEEYKIHVGK